MKRLFKILVNVLAIALLSVFALSLTACNDISKVEVKLQIYNNNEAKFYDVGDVTMNIELYGHLAPNTVKAIKGYIAEGYYDNAIIYQNLESNTYQYMFGELKIDENGNIVQNKRKSEIKGEFTSNGVKNSEISPNEGAIGLWRSYYTKDLTYKTSSNARNSGRAELFAPTASNSSLEGYFCIFAKFDINDSSNSKAVSALDAIFEDSDNYTEYVIYYTGEYNTDEALNNYGLTFNIVKAVDFNEYEVEGLFKAEGSQLEQYNVRKIKVPNFIKSGETNKSSAQIISAKIK